MNFGNAMNILARSAGDELMAFMGDTRPSVSDEAVHEAGAVIVDALTMVDALEGVADLILAEQVDRDELVRMAIEQVKIQAFEAYWFTEADRFLTRPAARAGLIAFIESRTGRPLAFDNPEHDDPP